MIIGYLTCCDIMNYNIDEEDTNNRECGYDYDTRARCEGCPHYVESPVYGER